MECKMTSEWLSEYYFGVINEQQRSAVEDHLSVCKTCLQSLFSLKKDIELGRLSQTTLSQTAKTSLENQAAVILAGKRARLRSPKGQKQFIQALALAAAAAVTITFVAFEFVAKSHKDEKTESQPIPSLQDDMIIDNGGQVPGHISTL